MSKLSEIKIIKNASLSSGKYFLMELDSPYLSKVSKPGQFIHIRCSETSSPLLRRPFSIHDAEKNRIKILYQIVGEGTGLLSRKKAGESVDVLGPLGSGFSIKKQKSGAFIFAGGIGIAPFLFLAKKLKEKNKKVTIFIGGKTKKDILGVSQFKKLGINPHTKTFGVGVKSIHIATEDGSCGKKGFITCLINNNSFKKINDPEIYACGPWAMMKEVAGIALKNKLSGQVSLDKRMACGLGACLSCVVKIKGRNRRICAEGPVFDIKEVDWEED